MKRQVTTEAFFARHPVFSLEEAALELAPPGGKSGTVERLKHHLASGRLVLLARELYAVVPPGMDPRKARPDPFLAAVAARSDAIFSHHSALELLGAAHSVWRECTAYSRRRRRPLVLTNANVHFLEAPVAMALSDGRSLGTRKVERSGRILETTGPERTLVEGFRKPRLVGGLEELLVSASGFATLDLDLLEQVLERYGVANLWSSTGWFLERMRATFHASDALLERFELHVPSSPQYLERGRRGGRLARRWNLIVPTEVDRLGEPDER